MSRKHMAIFLLSLVIGILGSIFYVKARFAGTAVPIYVFAMLAYGGIFILFTIIDSAARTYKKMYRGK